MSKRNPTREVRIGSVALGAGHPVAVQSMCATHTQDVEASVQLEDILTLFKRMLRNVNNMTFALNQLENMVDFVTTIEPLLKSSVPKLISYLDELEQRGVFRIIQATLDLRAKIAATYSPEDIEQIGDGMVVLLGLAKKLAEPQAIAFLESFAELPAKGSMTSS